MKYLITGLLIAISGLLLSIQNANERDDNKQKSPKKVNIEMYVYLYLVPVGLTIATAGVGEIMHKNGEKKSGKYKSMYYKKALKKPWYLRRYCGGGMAPSLFLLENLYQGSVQMCVLT
jgi:hypothetical protein